VLPKPPALIGAMENREAVFVEVAIDANVFHELTLPHRRPRATYLINIFSYCGSLSLSRELVPVTNIHDIKAGDVFIRGGTPGHAVIVLDVAINRESGKKIFLLAQSYMPAQEIHILNNPNREDLSPWYEEDFGDELMTPQYTFTKNELMRFP